MHESKAFFVVAMLCLVGCGVDPRGGEGQPCFEDGTCLEGYRCAAAEGNVCVDPEAYCGDRDCGTMPGEDFFCGDCPGATEYCSEQGRCVDDCADRVCGPSPAKGFECGSCAGETEYCTDAGRCVDDCEGRECGASPRAGLDCGSCSGETVYCSAAGLCVDDCEGRECGYSPVEAFECGTCTGPTDWCNDEGLCEDDCAGRECGWSPHAGHDCGSCLGATEYCSDDGLCVDDCAGRQCGESPSIGAFCGDCPGATDWCNAAGACVDDCAGRVCGRSPNAGHDCGTCPGAADWCTPEGQCIDDCAGRVCGLSPNAGHDCGSCASADQYCTAAGQCADFSAIGFEWIAITGGAFMMGSSESEWTDTYPAHQVTVSDFFINRTEVTVEQYRACVDAGVCQELVSSDECNWDTVDRDDHPVNCVPWHYAADFCAWAGGRLPTEAEWEYAARSQGQDVVYPWGDTAPSCEVAVMMGGEGLAGCGLEHTWPVCSKPDGDTVQGLCDMAGNLLEWVQDRYHSNYEGAPDDGSAWVEAEDGFENERVGRGGHIYDSAPGLETRARVNRVGAMGGEVDGFRCARSDGN